MASYADAGLTATYELGVGGQNAGQSLVGGCPQDPVTHAIIGCAFGGLNPKVSNLNFLLPIGRSVYNALDMKLVENVTVQRREEREPPDLLQSVEVRQSWR